MMDSPSCKIRLNSGSEIELSIVRDDAALHRWNASITLASSFNAVDVEDAQESAIFALIDVLEKTIGNLRDLGDDLECRKKS